METGKGEKQAHDEGALGHSDAYLKVHEAAWAQYEAVTTTTLQRRRIRSMHRRVAPLLAHFHEGIDDAVVEKLAFPQGVCRWSFMVPTPTGEAITVTGLTRTTFTPHPKCTFSHWASTVRGKPFAVGEELETDALKHLTCRVYLVVHELETGGSVHQVVRLLPREEPMTERHALDEDRNPFEDDEVPLGWRRSLWVHKTAKCTSCLAACAEFCRGRSP
jgi:hypothetical protein